MKCVKILFCAIALLIFESVCYADDGITYKNTAKFLTGVIASAVVHEGAHALVAEVTDTPISWGSGHYNQPISFTENAESNSKGTALYSAGLLSHALTSEIILDVDRIDKNDAFVRGMMAWNIINPILYALDYWVIHSSNKIDGNYHQGDLSGIEHYSGKSSANAFAIGISAVTLFQAYRFIKTQDWCPEWLRLNENINLVPQHQGFLLTYSFDF